MSSDGTAFKRLSENNGALGNRAPVAQDNLTLH